MPPFAAPAFPPALRLEAHGLGMRRGYRLLFEGLGVTLASGTITQLTGPNGAGKSTLLRLLAGFMPLENGSITWHGLGADEPPETLLHYHGHREGLSAALTAHENLDAAARLLGGAREAILPALHALKAEALADLPVGVLSAGQKRRVSLARLLVAPRPLWLLDEPLAALDHEGQALVATLIENHARAGGMALVATHQALPYETNRLDLVAFSKKRAA